MPAKYEVFFSETQDFSITFGKISFFWILTNTLFFIKTKAMAKAISMPNPLFAWSYWFLLWDRRLFWGLRLSWQKIYLMQKKIVTWAKSWDLIMFFRGQYLAVIEPQIDLLILLTYPVRNTNGRKWRNARQKCSLFLPKLWFLRL